MLKKAIIVLLSLCVGLSVSAQTVTRQFSDATLKEVLEEIESQTNYAFFYDNAVVNTSKKVTATFNATPLKTVLDKILGDSYSYTINGKLISINAKIGKPVQPAVQPAPVAAREAVQMPEEKKPYTLTGTIYDGKGLPVIGAAVLVRGKKSYNGSITDIDGHFEIPVLEDDMLQVSCIGYAAKDVAVAGKHEMSIILDEDSEMIEETVVVGYGVQKKESVVGAISQVSSEALVNSGQTNITQALSGKVSGMFSYQESGEPGADDATFYLRGYSSWNGNAPLVMVDGVERSFNNLDPNEVESISVLKDASATAVFGAKGANGVILVTTKKGKVGKPKMHLSVNAGLQDPVTLPEVINAETTFNALNIAIKNDMMYGSQFSKEEIAKYTSGENKYRYPDVNWYSEILKPFTPSTNVSYSVSGGTEKVKYYVNIAYKYDGSIVKDLVGMNKNFTSNRFNYRANIDYEMTESTTVSAKLGGFTKMKTTPAVEASTLFTYMYAAPGVMFPAYFGEDALLMYPDWDYPDASGIRRSNKGVAYNGNPYSLVASGNFTTTNQINLNSDLEVNQKLDMIAKGLSLNAKISYATTFYRDARSAKMAYPSYSINWLSVDTGEANPWESNYKGDDVYRDDVYKVSMSSWPNLASYTFYWEGSAHYDREFNGHNISAMALMHQRNYVMNADFPSRTEAYVGRINYNYKGRYLLEANIGITGSEQFAPQNRFGVFPSLAAGYFISKEKFWQDAMPWWSTFKIRYSDGIVGSDAAKEKWLYFSAFEKGENIIEGKAANLTARWEKAHKRNLGFEMGWFKDNLMLNVELFNEKRTDILMPPLTTMFVAVDYKDMNAGAIDKHGIEMELKWRDTTDGGLYYEIGGMIGLNENRITAYEESTYIPEYQQMVGKPYGCTSIGETTIGEGYFGTVDSKHGYPGGNDNFSQGRDYMYLDYNGDGAIDSNDLHPIEGSLIPPVTYSGHIALAWKGFSFDAMIVGTSGKYIGLDNYYTTEFSHGDYVLHSNQMNFWTPTNRNASHASLSINNPGITMFGTLNGKVSVDQEGATWQKSDYLTIKELRLAYKLKNKNLMERMGIDGLTITLTGNNLFTFTGLKDGDPEVMRLSESYYPIMRNVKLGVNLDF